MGERPASAPPLPRASARRPARRARITIAGRLEPMPDGDTAIVAGIRISHPERVLYEELGLTKVALARYYENVAEWMLPELKERPLSLVRCPQGPGEQCFYQKNIDEKFPAEIERVPVELGGGGLYRSEEQTSELQSP